MTYSVKNSALTSTFIVNDNTLNSTSTSLTFIGKNAAGYGLALNQDFLYLLENFSNTSNTYPANPVAGQLFWDNTNKYMHVYDGAAWKVIYGALTSLTVNTSISASTISAGVIGNTGAQIYGANIAITGNAIIQNGLALNSNASLVTDQTTASLFNATATTINIGGAATTVSIGAGTGTTTVNNALKADSFTSTGGGQLIGYHTGAIGANTANSGVFTTVVASGNITAQTANVYAAYVVANTGLFGAIATNSQPFITSVGTLSGLVSSANITAQTANVYAAYLVANTGLFGAISTNAQPFITSVGTLSGLVSSANITAQTANVYAAYVVANSGLSGTLITNAQTNITSVGTLSSLNVGGAILLSAAGAKITFNTGGGTIANNIGNALQFYTDGGTNELMRLDNNGNLNVYGGAVRAATINANVVGNIGSSHYGTIATNAQPFITSVGTLSGLVSSANITAQSANLYAASIIANTATYSAAYFFSNGSPFTSGAGATFAGGTITSAIVPSSNASINIGGTSAQYFNNVYAINFLGTSTTAKYADLAEKYLPDADYEIGTVMMVGGTAEVTQHNGDRIRAIGVTSAYPAYKMNSDLDGGVYVALKGRVPVRVVGPVKKGQSLFGTAHGLAMATDDTTPTIFAVALHSFDGSGIGSVEAVIL